MSGVGNRAGEVIAHILGGHSDGSGLWIMPPGAEPIGKDGRQLFYATQDGSGSVISVGGVETVTFDLAYPED